MEKTRYYHKREIPLLNVLRQENSDIIGPIEVGIFTDIGSTYTLKEKLVKFKNRDLLMFQNSHFGEGVTLVPGFVINYKIKISENNYVSYIEKLSDELRTPANIYDLEQLARKNNLGSNINLW